MFTIDDPELRACATRVRSLKKATAGNIVEIGKELTFAKKRLGHGHFGDWLGAEVAMSERTAERFMRAATWAEGRTATVSVLDATAIYLLSARSTPETAIADVMTRIARGEPMPVEGVRVIVKMARAEMEIRREELSKQARAARRHRREN